MSRALARYRHRLVRYNPGALPNLIVIGAMKCATTSLHWYLDLHPQVAMSRPKQVNLFVTQQELRAGDIEGYCSRFPADVPVRGESSPSYTKKRKYPGVPERISRFLPDARLVYIIRDPIERIISHYAHEWASRVEERKFDEGARQPRAESFRRTEPIP